MAMNRFMHPRNIYKTPPDFIQLAKDFSEFSKITKTDVTGKVTIDFKDPQSLRVLTKCTGACAIYPLLAAVKNQWLMYGTETDANSLKVAQENIQKNNLQDLIKLKINTTSSIIDYLFTENETVYYDFCMCNPPFYSTMMELWESRSPARPPPKNGFTGSPQELITEGGELEFCRKLIAESKKYCYNILIFTSMIGHKFNLAQLIDDLKSDNINYTHTEFCQGRVTRWGLAWTFHDYDLLQLLPPRDKPRKKIQPLVFLLPELPNCTYDLASASNKVKTILDRLGIAYEVVEKRGNTIKIDMVAKVNTWSNQRRKRRQEKRMQEETDVKKMKSNNLELNDMKNGSFEITENTSSHVQSNAELVVNKVIEKNNEDSNAVRSTESEQEGLLGIQVRAVLKIFKKDNEILLETEFINGTLGKEGLHQIVQFIKNNWK
uniref:U6 small nuclear RNA (adenine-(43)-N(6))-methyltransferase n=1 Tax=Bombyx mori TaxID=7091 RepID=A0A8R1WNP1_BOMMO|nr:U6 small nuclear RNA (adenine-(43)-N(6))-methyltransferase isoform X2 [Bombyx mori]